MTEESPKQILNIRSPALKGLTEESTDALRQAVERKMLHKETFEEAWDRIFALKNSDADLRRLREVKHAMESGILERESESTAKRFSRAEALRLYMILEEQKRRNRIDELVDSMPKSYELITKEKRLDEVVDMLSKESIVVFDVETTGTDVWSDKIVGHVLSATSVDKHFYIPTDHIDDSISQLARDYVADKLRPIYENESIGLIAHNAKFDIAILRNNFEIGVNNLVWDTMEAQFLLNENEYSYALKPLASMYLKDKSYSYGELFGNIGFHEVPLKEALAYAAKDGDITYRLYKFQEFHMKKVGNIYDYFTSVEMPLMNIVSKIELRGYDIDDEYAKEYERELEEEIEQMTEEIRKELGDINLNSPAQLKPAIEKAIGKEIPDTNAKSTLKPLAKEYPIIKTLLKYREDSKTLGTYIKSLPKLKKVTGRVHAGLRQNGTVTGRFSSGEDKRAVSKDGIINIQNQSPEARSLFVAPKGMYIVNADFSAQEVRIIASLSQEDVLLDAFARGVDAYATLASEFFGKPYEECYKLPDGTDTEERKQMKVVLLSSMYGATKWGLSNSLGISVDQADEFRNDFFDKYKKIDAFIKQSQEYAKRHGFVWIGDKQRKRRLPEARKKRQFIPRGKWNDPKYDEAKKLNTSILKSMRQAPNAEVQGLAAIQTKITMLKMDELIVSKGWEWFAPIHDELVFFTHEDLTKEDIDAIDYVMTKSYLLRGVENKTDIEIQRRWGESITAEEYLNGKEVPGL